jgi:hypothetical protein
VETSIQMYSDTSKEITVQHTLGIEFESFCRLIKDKFDTIHKSNFKLYFYNYGPLFNGEKLKVTDNYTLSSALSAIHRPDLSSDSNPMLYYYHVADDKGSPTTLPACHNDKLSPLPINNYRKALSLSTSSRDTSIQNDFSLRVLLRDDNRCLFCETKENLQAAHLLGYAQGGKNGEDESLSEMFGKLKISGLFDTQNGITLCGACHKIFDAHQTAIDPTTNQLVVANCVLKSKDYVSKWRKLNGKEIKHRTEKGAWVTKELLQRQYELFQKANERRSQIAGKKPVVCDLCGGRFVNKKGLFKHRNNPKCVQNQQIVKPPSMLFTPDKNAMSIMPGNQDDDDNKQVSPII